MQLSWLVKLRGNILEKMMSDRRSFKRVSKTHVNPPLCAADVSKKDNQIAKTRNRKKKLVNKIPHQRDVRVFKVFF